MAQANRERARQIQEAIRHVLLHDWDPIGVRDVAEAQYEYDSYVGGVYRLMYSGASELQVIELLCDIEHGLGLTPGDRSKSTSVARKLCALDVRL